MSLLAKGLRKALKVARRRAPAAAAPAPTSALAVPRPPARAAAPPLAVPRPKPKPEPKRLPAPPRQLALPAPKPGPDLGLGVKPKGGQWLPDTGESDSLFLDLFKSPEYIASEGWRDSNPDWNIRTNEGGMAPQAEALRGWWDKAVPKYLKTNFGAPGDPMIDILNQYGDLYPRGLRGDGDWTEAVDRALRPIPVGTFTVPPHSNDIQTRLAKYTGDIGTPRMLDALDPARDLREIVGAQAPWMSKLPVSDMIHSFSAGAERDLGLRSFAGELHRTMMEEGLPPNLALTPERLQRMSFPQALAHAGEARRWQDAEQERLLQESLLNNPAVQTYKEYPDDYRWTELKMPEVPVPEGWVRGGDGPLSTTGVYYQEPGGGVFAPEDLPGYREAKQQLADALKAEGEIMDHCVGGYCEDVASGRSRIFSLRDPKGQPHATIEMLPQMDTRMGLGNALNEIEPGIWDQISEHPEFMSEGTHALVKREFPQVWEQFNKPFIEQIKGKTNIAPNERYLPYVQDFIRSGDWSGIEDLGHAQMTRLPDVGYRQRYIDTKTYDDTMERATAEMGGERPGYWWQPHTMEPDKWAPYRPYFKEYARGGLVAKPPCGCAKCSLAVKRRKH